MIDTDATTARVRRGAKEHRNISGHGFKNESERTEQRGRQGGGERERERERILREGGGELNAASTARIGDDRAGTAAGSGP